MKREQKNLPKGWRKAVLDDLLIRMSNGANVTQHAENIGFPITRIETIWNGFIDLCRVKYIVEHDDDFVEKYRLLDGDILFSHINSDSHLGKTAVFKNQTECLIHGINLLLIRPSEFLSSDYLNYQFQYLRYKGAFVAVAQRAVNQSSINQRKLKSFEFLIAPWEEQRRIVAKIEELFSELDNGIESLKTVKKKLEVYRQAVLKHAFEGKLTAKWREANKDKLETADDLLALIKQEREARCDQQLAEWKEAVKEWERKGKPGKRPSKPPKPIILESLQDSDLPKLPKGWIWVPYGGLCSLVRNGISKKPSGDTGTKIFRISAVRPMEFDLGDVRYINDPDEEFANYYLKQGDLVFTRYNGSRAYVGVCAEYKSDGSHLYPDKLIRTQLATELTLPSYIEKAVNSGQSRRFIESKIRTTAGQSGVSGSDIKSIPVPLCSPLEQAVIQDTLELELSKISQLLREIDQNLARAQSLRQSILKKAFSGELVPQDPNDEPASVLLERIKKEKAAQVKPKNKRRKRKDVA